AMIPPGEGSVKITLRIIENKSDTAGMGEAAFERRSEISLGVATQRVGAGIERDSQQRRRSRADSSWRADWKLDRPLAEHGRVEEGVDGFDQLSCGGCGRDRRKHEAQGRANISEMVDVQDVRGAPKPLNQVVEFLTVVETVNFETNRQQPMFDTPEI